MNSAMLAGLDEDGEATKLEVTWAEAAPLLGPVGSQSTPRHGMRVAPSRHALLHEQDQGLLSPKAFLHECKKSVGGVFFVFERRGYVHAQRHACLGSLCRSAEWVWRLFQMYLFKRINQDA